MNRLLILFLIGAASATMVLLGGLITADKTKYNNDFARVFPPHAADINKMFKITSHRINLAGISDCNFYLQDSKGILEIGINTMDTNRVSLDLKFGSFVSIDSPFFFIHKGSSASLKRGSIQSGKIDTVFQDFPGFTAIQMVSPNDAVIQRMIASDRENVLTKPGGRKKYVLKKQVDGLLCTDGLLQFSKELNQVIYVYRYRNQFVYLDTALNFIRYGKTIDTTSVAKISVSEVDGKLTMAKPPLAVNNDAYVDGKYLFVQSNLMARNELIERAKGKSVIDVYDLTDGSYRFSFYIENYEGSKMQEFRIKGTKLVALFKQAVITYDLPKKYLP